MTETEFSRFYLGTMMREYEPKPDLFGKMTEHLLDALPDSFDSRTEWSSCIHPIRD